MRSNQLNYVPVHRSEEWPGDTGERARIAGGMAEQNIPRVHGPTIYSPTAWARRTRGPPVADRRPWTLTLVTCRSARLVSGGRYPARTDDLLLVRQTL